MITYVVGLFKKYNYVLISLFCYLVFFYPLLNPDTVIWGNDLRYFYYPARVYLNERLHDGEFPFWTERIFSGFPLYADPETSYLNPLNTLSVFLFGPFLSYKLLHVFLYLIGSLSLYFLLKRKGFGLPSYFVANVAFYFNFFMLYHQQHQNIIFVSYLLPFNLLLADFLISSQKYKKRLLIAYMFSIVLSLYFGSFQAVFLSIVASFSYIIFLSISKINYIKVIITLLLVASGVFILALPLVFSAHTLWSESRRSSTAFEFKKGSLLPVMAPVALYPYMFGSGASYFGVKINDDYSEHELYVYLGVVPFVLGVFSLIFTKNDRFKYYCVFLFLVFLILGFLRASPLAPLFGMLPTSLFRYWVRASLLASLSGAFLSAIFVERLVVVLKVASVNRRACMKNALLILLPLLYLLVLFLLTLKDTETQRVLSFIASGNLDFSGIWLLVILLALMAILSILKNINVPSRTYVVWFLCFLALFDLWFFGKQTLDFKQVPKIYKEDSLLNKYEHKRIVTGFKSPIFGNEHLYYKNWSLFGYSQLVGFTYEERLKDAGFSFIKRSELKDLSQIEDTSLTALGVSALVKKNEERVLIQEPSLDLFPGLVGVYLQKREGVFKIRLEPLPRELKITSLVKYHPGWQLYVNGAKQILPKQEDVYLDLVLPQYTDTIELRFIPQDLYLGHLLSFSLFSIYLLILKVTSLKVLDY